MVKLQLVLIVVGIIAIGIGLYFGFRDILHPVSQSLPLFGG